MKTPLILSTLLLTLASPAFANMAVTYSCLGKNKVNGASVLFELQFSDYAREAGYTNQSITVLKRGWERLEKPVVFQMYGATKRNQCKKNDLGEIYLDADLEMTPTAQGDERADYTVSLKAHCGKAEDKLDVKAYCAFEY